MLRCNLNKLLAERGLRVSKVSADTNISRPTLTAMVYNAGKGVQYETLNTLCHYLNVSHCELYSYIPYDFNFSILDFNIVDKQGHEFGSFFIHISLYDRRGGLVQSTQIQCSFKIYQENIGDGEYIPGIRYKIEKYDFDEIQALFKVIKDESWYFTLQSDMVGTIEAEFDDMGLMVDHPTGIENLFADLTMLG